MYWKYFSILQVFKISKIIYIMKLVIDRGLSILFNTPKYWLTLEDDWVAGDPRELTYELTQFRRVVGASRLACTQQTHCGMHTSIFSPTQDTTRAGSLDYVRVESGRERARRT